MNKSQREQEFMAIWQQVAMPMPPGLAAPVLEHRFHQVRRWRFDFAWLDQKVAVEIEGGTFTGGRHTRGLGHHQDCDKYNAAILDGWKVLRFTSLHLTREPMAMVETIASILMKDVNHEGDSER